jgi:prephenate dehydrogenase
MSAIAPGPEQTVTVVGVGLIGGSLCAGLRKNGMHLRGVSSETSLRKAGELGIIDQGFSYDQLEEAVRGSGYVFLCAPLAEIMRQVGTVMECADRGTIVTDVGSTKGDIAEAAGRHRGGGVHFIGGHPMAGSEKRGVENASPFLFYDAAYVLAPLDGVPKKPVRRLSGLLAGLGARVMVIPPELHDRIAADVSHLPQLIAVLLVNHLANRDDDLFRNLAAGGFRDMTRIASSSFGVWRDIIDSNRPRIRRVLEEFGQNLNELVEGLESDDYLSGLFDRAGRERATIPRYGKGFLKPLTDLRVSVKDRPGELARITGLIYYHEVNIRDIEIVSVREGEGGILRLGFAGRNDASRAAEALTAVGYEVSLID